MFKKLFLAMLILVGVMGIGSYGALAAGEFTISLSPSTITLQTADDKNSLVGSFTLENSFIQNACFTVYKALTANGNTVSVSFTPSTTDLTHTVYNNPSYDQWCTGDPYNGNVIKNLGTIKLTAPLTLPKGLYSFKVPFVSGKTEDNAQGTFRMFVVTAQEATISLVNPFVSSDNTSGYFKIPTSRPQLGDSAGQTVPGFTTSSFESGQLWTTNSIAGSFQAGSIVTELNSSGQPAYPDTDIQSIKANRSCTVNPVTYYTQTNPTAPDPADGLFCPSNKRVTLYSITTQNETPFYFGSSAKVVYDSSVVFPSLSITPLTKTLQPTDTSASFLVQYDSSDVSTDPLTWWEYNNSYFSRSGNTFTVLSRPTVATTTTITAHYYSVWEDTTKTAQASVTILPAAATKNITITQPANNTSYSFTGNSANSSTTVPVTITATGFDNVNQIISQASSTPPLSNYIKRADFAITSTSSSIVNGVTAFIIQENLVVTRNGNSSTTVITGPLAIIATSTDGTTKGDSITINITINIGTPSSCSLSLTPPTAIKSFGTDQLPTTAAFPFTLTKTGTCGTITYTPALLPDSQTTQSWVTSSSTQSSYTATVSLPQNAIQYLSETVGVYPLIGGVTATDVSGASTTALWATVIGNASQPAISLDVSPLSGPAPLQVSATATPSGFSSAPTSYAFSFGDGTVSDVLATNIDSHTYANPTATTTYTVLVVATNNSGQSAWTSKIVTVYPPNTGGKGDKTLSFVIDPSTITVQRPATGSSTASFNGTISWNANLQSNANLSIPSWTGISGSNLTYIPANNCSGPSASSPCSVSFTIGNITNATSASTPFSVTASKDGVSASSSATLLLTDVVNPLALSASLTAAPRSGTSPLSVSARVTASNGTPPYTYSIDYGDGYTAAGSNGSYMYDVYSRLTSTTTYTITGKVTDATGLSASATKGITVYPANQQTVIPVSCSLSVNKPMGLPPFRPTFTITPSGGNSGLYTVKLDPTGTGSPVYTLASPYTSNQYIFTISGQYSSKATVSDTNNPSNTATCTLPTPLQVLSGSGGETNAGQ